MRVPFKKMNGSGNDFVVIDNRHGGVLLTGAQIARICDRRRGVGADGLILVESAPGHDFFMHFYNSDGSEAEMCGNGACCSAAFAAALGLGVASAGGKVVRFATGSGAIEARVAARVSGDTRAAGAAVAMEMMDARGMRLEIPVRVAQATRMIHFVIVGTRHAVVTVDDARALSGEEVTEWGRIVRWDTAFAPEGANVNFASIDGERRIHLRTYEKGVEAETHACGTGSVAAAVVFAHQKRCSSPAVVVQSTGDVLRVSFELEETGATRVFLEGPADVNFEGAIDI